MKNSIIKTQNIIPNERLDFINNNNNLSWYTMLFNSKINILQHILAGLFYAQYFLIANIFFFGIILNWRNRLSTIFSEYYFVVWVILISYRFDEIESFSLWVLFEKWKNDAKIDWVLVVALYVVFYLNVLSVWFRKFTSNFYLFLILRA